MDRHSLVTVYTVTNLIEAEIIQNALRAEGIRCEIGGAGQAGLDGLLEIELLTSAEDADRAAKLIDEHDQRVASIRKQEPRS